MNQSEKQINPKQLAELLERSSRQLDSKTSESLQQMRMQAVDRLRVKQGAQSQLNGQGTLSWLPANSWPMLATGLLVAAVVVVLSQTWQPEPEYDKSRLDIAILTDDMPLEAFVDQQSLR